MNVTSTIANGLVLHEGRDKITSCNVEDIEQHRAIISNEGEEIISH